MHSEKLGRLAQRVPPPRVPSTRIPISKVQPGTDVSSRGRQPSCADLENIAVLSELDMVSGVRCSPVASLQFAH